MKLKDLIEYIEALEYRSSNITEKSDYLYVRDLLDRFGTIKRHLQNYEYMLKDIIGK